MKKTTARTIVNHALGTNVLQNSNTHFASEGDKGWWLNIPVANFSSIELFILLATKNHKLLILKIPKNTFEHPEREFRIWEAKKAVDLMISSNPQDRYLKDIYGSEEVNFKSFVIDTIDIPDNERDQEELKLNNSKPEVTITNPPAIGNLIVKKGQTNISYKSLFADYLVGATNITLQDPYIRYPHQIHNLVEFCQMLHDLKASDQKVCIELITNRDTNQVITETDFKELAKSATDFDIQFTYHYDKHVHDRYLQADNGWKIILGRGLDIFERPDSRYSLAVKDQTKRKCKACEITYIRNDCYEILNNF